MPFGWRRASGQRVVLARGPPHSLTTSKSGPAESIMIPEGLMAPEESGRVREWQPTVASPVSARAFRASLYRFRATIRQRWPGYLSIVLLIGLVGGVAMTSIAGARRSQSTFGAYLEATRASNLQLQTSSVSDQFGITTLSGKLAQLPHVQHVADAPSLLVIPLGADGKALPSAFNNNDVQEVGSRGGMYFSQDQVIVTQGQMADPASTDEMVATAAAARLSGWHVGQTVPFGGVLGAAGEYVVVQPPDGKALDALLGQTGRSRRVLEPGRQ